MTETQDWAAAINAITTMADLGRVLKRRRIAVGYDSLPELLRNAKQGFPLPRSTAYTVEEGSQRSRWISVEAYLRSCNVKVPEIELWREAHGRALLNYGTQKEQLQSESVTIPTAKQLAEMGPEQGARILADIDTETAADLLRRIDVKRAVQLVPEIHLSVVLSLLAEVGQARVNLIFEQIETGRGAELLAEMKTEDALIVMDEVGTRRAAELMGAMPRGRAARILRSVTADQAVRILATMAGRHATALLPDLDAGVLEKLLDSAGDHSVADMLNWMDSEVASGFLTGRASDERALKIMARMDAAPLARCLGRAGLEPTLRLAPRIPIAQLAAVFGLLHRDVQIELLTHSLNLQQAQEVLLEWIEQTSADDRIVVVWLVEEMPVTRMAEIVRSMDTPYAILFLATMNSRTRQQLLAEIPEEEAAVFTTELTPDRIAWHLSRIPSRRARSYLYSIQIPSGLILSRIGPAAAIEILLEDCTFEDIVNELTHVTPERAALMLEAIGTETTAHIITDLPIERAEEVITTMNQEFAAEMISHVRQNVDFRFYNQGDITAEEWDKVRTRRQEFAMRLQGALSRAGQSRQLRLP